MERITAIAKRGEAALTLISVVEPIPWYSRPLLSAPEQLQGALTRKSTERLESLAAPLRHDDLKIDTKVLCGRTSHELIREVLRSRHDLVVKVAEPDRGNAFGSLDMRLLRNCPCPVLLFHREKQDKPFRRTVAAVDPLTALDVPEDLLRLRENVNPEEQALNVKLLKLATALTAPEGGELHVVHAWSAAGEDLLRSDEWLPRKEVDSYVASVRNRAHEALGRLLADCPDASCRRFLHLVKGRAADVISDFARTQDVDLIVMGTVVRTGIPGLLIGNTAETVFHQVECSILAAKPDSFVSPVTLEG
jgi:nucleotide-binding universal stress UspA family protein